MKLVNLIASVAAIMLFCSSWSAAAEGKNKLPTVYPTNVTQPKRMAKKADMRTILIERKRASQDTLKNSLSYYENKLAGQAADLDIKKKLYLGQLISQQELENSERAFAALVLCNIDFSSNI